MKIAVATEGNFVSPHFGRCLEYTLVTVTPEGEIGGKTVIPNPGHKLGFLPGYLVSLGVSHIIAGGWASGPNSFLQRGKLLPWWGVTGPVDTVIREYLQGELVSGESLCTRGKGGHERCNHEESHHECME